MQHGTLYHLCSLYFRNKIFSAHNLKYSKLPTYEFSLVFAVVDSFIPLVYICCILYFALQYVCMDQGSYCVSFLRFPEEEAAEGIINFPCAIVKSPICREQQIHTSEQFSQKNPSLGLYGVQNISIV